MSGPREPRRRLLFPVVLIVVLATLGAILGFAGAVLRGDTYVSESTLTWDPTVRAQVDPAYVAPDQGTFDRQVADQEALVLSDAVVGAVATAADETPRQVRERLSVSSTAGSAAFLIQATGDTPDEARAIARAATAAYLDALSAQNTARLEARIENLQPVIVDLRRQLANSTAVAAGPLAADVAELATELASATVAAEDVPVEATVQRAAARPAGPASLTPLVQGVVGAALGIVLAVCVLLVLGGRRPAWGAAPATVPVRAAAPGHTNRPAGGQVATAPAVPAASAPSPAPAAAAFADQEPRPGIAQESQPAPSERETSGDAVLHDAVPHAEGERKRVPSSTASALHD